MRLFLLFFLLVGLSVQENWLTKKVQHAKDWFTEVLALRKRPPLGSLHKVYLEDCAHYCEQNVDSLCFGPVRCPFGEKLILGIKTKFLSKYWEGICQDESMFHSHSLCCNSTVFREDAKLEEDCEWYGHFPICAGSCPSDRRLVTEAWGHAWGEQEFGFSCLLGTKAFCCKEHVFVDYVAPTDPPAREIIHHDESIEEEEEE